MFLEDILGYMVASGFVLVFFGFCCPIAIRRLQYFLVREGCVTAIFGGAGLCWVHIHSTSMGAPSLPQNGTMAIVVLTMAAIFILCLHWNAGRKVGTQYRTPIRVGAV